MVEPVLHSEADQPGAAHRPESVQAFAETLAAAAVAAEHKQLLRLLRCCRLLIIYRGLGCLRNLLHRRGLSILRNLAVHHLLLRSLHRRLSYRVGSIGFQYIDFPHIGTIHNQFKRILNSRTSGLCNPYNKRGVVAGYSSHLE